MGTARFFSARWSLNLTYQLCDLVSRSLIQDLGSLSTQEHHFNQQHNICKPSTISLYFPWGRRKEMEVLIKSSLCFLHSTDVMKHPSWKCRRFQEAFKEPLLRRNNMEWNFKWSSQRRPQIGFFPLHPINQNYKQTTFPTRHKINWQRGEVSVYLFLFKMT